MKYLQQLFAQLADAFIYIFTNKHDAADAPKPWQPTLVPPPTPDVLPSDATPPQDPDSDVPADGPRYHWDTVQKARHSVRVICDEEGLTVEQKNTLCATVGAESGWQSYHLSGTKKGQPVKLENKRAGKVWSTDFGICQINDHYHIGPGKSFTSAEYVLEHPEACIRWMCRHWKAGHRDLWIAYKSGAYKKFL